MNLSPTNIIFKLCCHSVGLILTLVPKDLIVEGFAVDSIRFKKQKQSST